jgi:ribosomal-protein-alanine N-acetyltransferase
VTGWLEPQPAGGLVLLRPPARGDEPALIEMAVDAEVRRYVGGPANADVALEKASRKVSSSTWGQFVVVERAAGDVVGSGDLAQKRGPWEVSYQLRRAYWGRGFAGEALALITEWFFAFTTEHLLIATTQRANPQPSSAVERNAVLERGA